MGNVVTIPTPNNEYSWFGHPVSQGQGSYSVSQSNKQFLNLL